jgi:hypothetical protein
MAGALLATLAAPLTAQTIRGQVVESQTGSLVGAGFVVLLAPDGREVARTLADDAGRFSIRAPAAGSWRLRSERIGFRVSTTPPISLGAGESIEYRL